MPSGQQNGAPNLFPPPKSSRHGSDPFGALSMLPPQPDRWARATPCTAVLLYNSDRKYESSPEILVVTPSVFKHVFSRKFALRLRHLVFDEADIMLTHKSGAGKWSHIEQILREINIYHKDKLLCSYQSNLHKFSIQEYLPMQCSL